MSRVVANDVALHVQELGAPTAHPPVVMLHGLLLGNLASWYFAAAPRLAEAARVVLYDLRGHGRSDRTQGGYDVATLAADLGALRDELALGPVDLVGHSYGALVALHFALDHPGAVRRLVLVEAPLPPSTLADLGQWVDASPDELLAALPEGMRASLEGGGRRARRLVESLGFLLGDSSLVADLRAAEDVADARLAELSHPTLCVYGAQSSCRGVGDRLARVLPDARLVELDGGHYLPMSHGAELGALAAEFLHG